MGFFNSQNVIRTPYSGKRIVTNVDEEKFFMLIVNKDHLFRNNKPVDEVLKQAFNINSLSCSFTNLLQSK